MSSWRECEWTGDEHVEIVVQAESYHNERYKHIRYVGNFKSVLIAISDQHSYGNAKEMFEDNNNVVTVIQTIDSHNGTGDDGDDCDFITKMTVNIDGNVFVIIDELPEEEIVHVT